MMVADFARLSPSRRADLAVGGYFTRPAGLALAVGRTDAGRPQLPRPQEVYS